MHHAFGQLGFVQRARTGGAGGHEADAIPDGFLALLCDHADHLVQQLAHCYPRRLQQQTLFTLSKKSP